MLYTRGFLVGGEIACRLSGDGTGFRHMDVAATLAQGTVAQ